jgi:hypothetical protein
MSCCRGPRARARRSAMASGGACETKTNRRLVASCQAAGSERCWARSSAEWPGDRAWRFSASETTARATVTAVYRSGAVTVTTLMILLARCALIMLADLRHAARSAVAANLAGSGPEPPSHATVTVTL